MHVMQYYFVNSISPKYFHRFFVCEVSASKELIDHAFIISLKIGGKRLVARPELVDSILIGFLNFLMRKYDISN